MPYQFLKQYVRKLYPVGFWALAVLLLTSPLSYVAVLNWVGPSTEYHDPQIGTAHRGEDGRDYVFVGDEFYVWITIVRHRLNGNCFFDIERFAEATEGPNQGVPRLISKTALQFVGQNELRRTRWPVPSEKYIMGWEVDEYNRQVAPLLPDGIDEQPFDFYVRGRYYCNLLDYVIPRYIQGNFKPDETSRVHAVVKRRKS